MKEMIQYRTFFERFRSMSESLQMSSEIVDLISIFRDFLHDIIPHADRVSINLNIEWHGAIDDDNEDLRVIIDDLLFPNRPRRFIPGHADGSDDGKGLLRQMKDAGFPFEIYKPPTIFTYNNDGSYLGSLIVWQKISHDPIANVDGETMAML